MVRSFIDFDGLIVAIPLDSLFAGFAKELTATRHHVWAGLSNWVEGCNPIRLGRFNRMQIFTLKDVRAPRSLRTGMSALPALRALVRACGAARSGKPQAHRWRSEFLFASQRSFDTSS